jgi:hypothetical protein
MRSLVDVFAGLKKAAGPLAATDPTAEGRWPTLLALLTVRDSGGKGIRQTSTLTVLAEDGVFKGGLRDRQEGVSLWVSSSSLLGVYDALEGALQATTVNWRKTPDYKPRDRQKT